MIILMCTIILFQHTLLDHTIMVQNKPHEYVEYGNGILVQAVFKNFSLSSLLLDSDEVKEDGKDTP